MQYTEKQKKAFKALTQPYTYYLFDGSARCGKTWLICGFLYAFGYRYKGIRILMCRYRFNHAKASLWTQTFIPFLEDRAKGQFTVDKSDYIVRMSWGTEYWLGGLDDGDRLDKILGTEYAVIFLNEGTQVSYDIYQTLKTRLNWKGVPLKFIIDCNPKNPRHWLHRLYINYINPDTNQVLDLAEKEKIYRLNWHVQDNKDNLSDEYLSILDSMTGVRRKRLLDGIWADTSEGTVFIFSRAVNHIDKAIGYVDMAETWAAMDFGIAAATFIVWFQVLYIQPTPQNKKGVIINIIDEYEDSEKTYKHYAEIMKGKPYHNVRYCGDPAGRQRDAKLQSWFSLLKEEGINLQHKTSCTVADMISRTNEMMPYVRVNEMQCPKIVEMFENWSYPKDADGRIIDGKLPVHDEYSHPGSAFYYGIANAFPVKKSSGVYIY